VSIVKKVVSGGKVEGLFDVKGVVKELGLSEVWVGRMFREGKFVGSRKIEGKWFVGKEGLEKKRKEIEGREREWKKRVGSGKKGYGEYKGVRVKGLEVVLGMLVEGKRWKIEDVELEKKVLELLGVMLKSEREEWEKRKGE